MVYLIKILETNSNREGNGLTDSKCSETFFLIPVQKTKHIKREKLIKENKLLVKFFTNQKVWYFQIGFSIIQ